MSNKSISETIENASDEEMKEILFSVLKWFKKKSLGNPFNYNRAFEWLQAEILKFKLTTVGGGSDGYNDEATAEFKATVYKGLTKKGVEKAHSFSYNGTTRKDNLEEQEEYCRKKIMRDPFHYWSMIDYDRGTFVKTLKVSDETVWKLLWPKWERSFYNSKAADPRIGGSVSTNDLIGEQFELITH
jgi:hypothetical protein